VLSRLPGAEVSFVAEEAGLKRTDTGALAINADLSLAELAEPEIVLVPGGKGNRSLLGDEGVLGWLRAADRTSTWTTSVCTGSLVLGAAGLLAGRRATSHWLYRDSLACYGAEPVVGRVVEDGKLITAAGVSAGIDMALTLAARIAGDEVAQTIQLGIEYAPEPPFDSGSPESAPERLVELLRASDRPAPLDGHHSSGRPL